MKSIGFASTENDNAATSEVGSSSNISYTKIIDEYYKSIRWYMLAILLCGIAAGSIITWGITYAYTIKHFAKLGAYIQTTETYDGMQEKIVIDANKINLETDVWKK